MIDYDRAEAAAVELLRSLREERSQRRCLMLRLACFIAALEFVVIVAGTIHALR
jgi:hypothetical protein